MAEAPVVGVVGIIRDSRGSLRDPTLGSRSDRRLYDGSLSSDAWFVPWHAVPAFGESEAARAEHVPTITDAGRRGQQIAAAGEGL